jgi:NADH:ubiquinone oxidoreductase subunit 3 (subunit A)
MPVWSWFFIAAAVVFVITLVMVLVLSVTGRTRTERLKRRFGREYERVVGEAGDQRAGEEELVARERKRQELEAEKKDTQTEPEAKKNLHTG